MGDTAPLSNTWLHLATDTSTAAWQSLYIGYIQKLWSNNFTPTLLNKAYKVKFKGRFKENLEIFKYMFHCYWRSAFTMLVLRILSDDIGPSRLPFQNYKLFGVLWNCPSYLVPWFSQNVMLIFLKKQIEEIIKMIGCRNSQKSELERIFLVYFLT